MGPFLTSYRKIHLKSIIDLNIKAKTIKLPEETISINLHDLGLGKSYLDMTLKVQANKWGK